MARAPVLAVCGSLRADSLNRALLRAFESAAPDLRFIGTEVVPELPLYNPDLVDADLPPSVRELRLLAGVAWGAVVVSPEYVHGPSGVTKNVFDWLADSVGVTGKPVLLASASPGDSGGVVGLAGLVPVLRMLGAELLDPMPVSRAGSRLLLDGTVTDAALATRIGLGIGELTERMRQRERRSSWSLSGGGWR